MIPEAARLALVDAARRAPSGFNRQPWQCFFSGSRVLVREHEALPRSRFDPGGRYTAVSLAGFVHHLIMAAPSAGLRARLEGVGSGRPLEAALRLAPSGRRRGAAPGAIGRRATHRETYAAARFPPGFLTSLERLVQVPDVGVEVLTGPGRVARALAGFEALSLRCSAIRREVLDGMCREAGAAVGIPLRSLQLPPLFRLGLRLALPARGSDLVWAAVARVWGRIAAARIASSTVLVSLSLPGDRSVAAYHSLGMALNEVWTALSQEGYGCCPIFSFAFPRVCPGGCALGVCTEGSEEWWRACFASRPEILLRVGLPTRPAPPTPRRPVSDILIDPPSDRGC